jgi:hypothetical protein
LDFNLYSKGPAQNPSYVFPKDTDNISTKSFTQNHLQANSNYGTNYLNSNTYANNQTSKNQVYALSNLLPNDNGIVYTNQENTNSNYINQSSYFPSYSGQEYVNQSYDSSQYKYNSNANSNATLASQTLSTVSNGNNFQAKKPLTDSILNQTNKRDEKKKPSMAQIKNSSSKLESKKVNSQKSISDSLSPLSNTFSSPYLSSTDEQAQIFITDTDGQSDNVESTEDEENEDGDDESEMDDSDNDNDDDDEEEDDDDGDEKAKDKKSAWNKSALSAPWIQPGEHFKLFVTFFPS